MERRTFVKALMSGGLLMAGTGLASCSTTGRKMNRITNTAPVKALVVWYSQTDHTARIGRVIQQAWQRSGLTVDAFDYRDLDATAVKGYDLIAIGTPVFYMVVPENLQAWIRKLPRQDGVAVAAFATFGGPGDGQHNTACRLLEMMSDLGAASVGLGVFGNMSTFAPTWSTGNSARTLKYKHLPNAATFQHATTFADTVMADVRAGRATTIARRFGMDSFMAALPQIAMVKLAIKDHHIDPETCNGCRTCVKKCPVKAINLGSGAVDSPRCIACMGCVNNCPTGAMKMTFAGKEVYGFKELLKRNNITIPEPPASQHVT